VLLISLAQYLHSFSYRIIKERKSVCMDIQRQEKIACVVLFIVALLLTLTVSFIKNNTTTGKMNGCYTLSTPHSIYRT
jgi:hypothetical protein